MSEKFEIDYKYRWQSDLNVSDSDPGVNAGKATRLERLLVLKDVRNEETLESYTTGSGLHDEETGSVVEFPFSDDDSAADIQPSISFRTNLLTEELTENDSGFSRIHCQVLEEIEAEKGLNSPCSLCSGHSSCSTDTTWRLLQLTENCLHIQPTPLDPTTKEQLDKLDEEQNKLLNEILSKIEILNDGKDMNHDQELHQLETRVIEEDPNNMKKLTERGDSFDLCGEGKDTCDNFFISPPGYNYYRDSKSKDIRIEKDKTPWAVKERSRNKCAKWLKSLPSD